MSDRLFTDTSQSAQVDTGVNEQRQTAPAKKYMSIGEVVESLSQEFEVSVSKIRFFETEGLIEPERTTSGYRKFYPGDIARLKYILRLQRDQFVPLKVIRQRLEHFDPQEAPDTENTEAQVAATNGDSDDELGLETGLNLTLDELVNASGLSREQLKELEDYGLIDSHSADGKTYYDEDDLLVAKIARDFSKYGVEPRHMRMYRSFADRESGIFEQIVLPRSRSAGTDGRRQVTQSLNELTKLSRRLKHILLRASLKNHLR
jgi:DNA-binding transcriptional MerR regulator